MPRLVNLVLRVAGIAPFVLGLTSTGLAAKPLAARPNVVLILLDNVGQEWFGCYGSEENCTPHIDRLARTGVRVENCYAPPICGPSRTVLLTGRYPHSTGFRLHHDAALYSGGGLDPQREVVFPRLLRDAGYATGMTGKWQINNLYDEPDAVPRHGFQEHLVWPGSIDFGKLDAGRDGRSFTTSSAAKSYDEAVAFNQHIESRYWNPVFLRNGKREALPGDLVRMFPRNLPDFLQRHRERPFFLYLPIVLTHGQTFSVPAVPTPLNRSSDRQPQAMFADMLRYADRIVGEIVAAIERLGLRDNTILFVASDNGTEHRFQAPPQRAGCPGRFVFADRGWRQCRAAGEQPATRARRTHACRSPTSRTSIPRCATWRACRCDAIIARTDAALLHICWAGRAPCHHGRGS